MARPTTETDRATIEIDADPRLPTHVVPRRYELELRPDLASAVFEGSVAIDVEVLETTDEIVLNAADLDITAVSLLTDGGARSGTELVPDIRIDSQRERAHLTFRDDVAPGPARLLFTFTGALNDRLRGFYRSTYADDDGHEHTIATTQFQSTDARRAFPCWDEPAWKATFATTLVVDADHLAVSNTEALQESIDPDGRRRVTFAETMVMSTYLVAFVVGPLEVTAPVDAGGVPVRVVHRPGKGHLTAFALDVATHALAFFEEYYDIPYPSDKVDLLAIPDFAFGAMENLGCITFREVLLLVDPEGVTQPELQNVADVINHELAHMWFGDLVTMRWWEGIWLNEAFATFMETSCSDSYRPDWRVWTTFARARAAAFTTDALATTRPIEFPVVTPEDAEGMYDILTYEKGASVVRMLETHLGPARFRDGVRHYLKAHSHGNTETRDLWDALEEVTGEPIRRMMTGWIHQGGYPVIDVEPTSHGARVRQRHFTLDPDASDSRTWAVPLRFRGDGRDHRLLLDGAEAVLTGIVGEVLTPNADAAGFFRVRPTMAMVRGARAGAGAAERHSLIDDAWALTLAGELSATDYLEMAELLAAGEDDLTVWQAISSGLAGLDRILTGPAATRLRSRVAAMARPVLDGVGLDPGTDDTDRTRELRATLIRLLGTVADDDATIAHARARRDHGDPTLAAAALAVVAHHGGRAEYGEVHAAWQTADDPQAEQRNLRALADFPDPALIGELLDEVLDGSVRTQDGPYLLRRALTNRTAGASVWEFLVTHWDELTERFPSNSVARMLEGIVALDDEYHVAATADFLAVHPVPQGEKQVAQHLEEQRIRAAFRRREGDRLATALDAHGTSDAGR